MVIVVIKMDAFCIMWSQLGVLIPPAMSLIRNGKSSLLPDHIDDSRWVLLFMRLLMYHRIEIVPIHHIIMVLIRSIMNPLRNVPNLL